GRVRGAPASQSQGPHWPSLSPAARRGGRRQGRSAYGLGRDSEWRIPQERSLGVGLHACSLWPNKELLCKLSRSNVGITQIASREGDHCPPAGGYGCHFL